MSESTTRTSIFQKPWTWWLLVVTLALVAVVRLRLLNLPLERDEGEYAYAGQLILQGIPPYELAYNMKFPGTYLAYAGIMAVFGQTPAGIHFGVLLMTMGTALMLFWLGRAVLDEVAGVVAATSYAALAASPTMLGLAGHATHFCAFFAVAGLCLMWRARQKETWSGLCAGGLLFGMSVLMKQHAVVIAGWAGLSFLCGKLFFAKGSFFRRLLSVAVYGFAMLTPFFLCCLWLWHAGVFAKFKFWTMDYCREYATIIPLSDAWIFLRHGLYEALPKGFLLLPFALAGFVLLWRDKRLASSRIWLFGFGVASVLSVVPDFYFRRHYFLLMLPGVALLTGSAVSSLLQKRSQKSEADGAGRLGWPVWIYLTALAVTVITCAPVWFWLTPDQVSRVAYNANPFPEAEPVATYIRTHSPPDARLAVLGSEPELYFLSHRHSVTGFIYTYGLMEEQPYASQMQKEMIHDVEASRPEYIVYVNNFASWVPAPKADKGIFNWWDSYQTNYTLVAVADQLSRTNTVYVWGADMVRSYGDTHGCALEVYERK